MSRDSDPPAPPVPPAHAVTTGMVGHGFYNRNSAPQWAATEYVLPWLETALSTLPLPDAATDPGACLRLADFGTSEGRNSVAVMQRLTAALRTRTKLPVQVVESDLPTNDFSELFPRLRPAGHSVFGDDGIFSAVVGGSMYDQLLPPHSLHLATTFNAIGFLSRKPLDRLPGYILPNGPSKLRARGRVTPAEQAAFARQARADTASFLHARAAELVPGGILMIQVFGCDGPHRTCDGIYDLLNDAVLGLLDEGRITGDQYELYYQPVYFRTLEEITSLVAGAEAPLARLFRLERAESYQVPVSFVEAFRESGDMETYARHYVGFFRAFTEAVLRHAFSDHARLDDLVREVYQRCESLLKANPERYPFRYVAVAALMTRLGPKAS